MDARGGAMRGCRQSGVRVIIPPRKAPSPMRVTCRYLRRDKMVNPPPLMEGEALASRILELGPAGAKFLGYLKKLQSYITNIFNALFVFIFVYIYTVLLLLKYPILLHCGVEKENLLC